MATDLRRESSTLTMQPEEMDRGDGDFRSASAAAQSGPSRGRIDSLDARSDDEPIAAATGVQLLSGRSGGPQSGSAPATAASSAEAAQHPATASSAGPGFSPPQGGAPPPPMGRFGAAALPVASPLLAPHLGGMVPPPPYQAAGSSASMVHQQPPVFSAPLPSGFVRGAPAGFAGGYAPGGGGVVPGPSLPGFGPGAFGAGGVPMPGFNYPYYGAPPPGGAAPNIPMMQMPGGPAGGPGVLPAGASGAYYGAGGTTPGGATPFGVGGPAAPFGVVPPAYGVYPGGAAAPLFPSYQQQAFGPTAPPAAHQRSAAPPHQPGAAPTPAASSSGIPRPKKPYITKDKWYNRLLREIEKYAQNPKFAHFVMEGEHGGLADIIDGLKIGPRAEDGPNRGRLDPLAKSPPCCRYTMIEHVRQDLGKAIEIVKRHAQDPLLQYDTPGGEKKSEEILSAAEELYKGLVHPENGFVRAVFLDFMEDLIEASGKGKKTDAKKKKGMKEVAPVTGAGGSSSTPMPHGAGIGPMPHGAAGVLENKPPRVVKTVPFVKAIAGATSRLTFQDGELVSVPIGAPRPRTMPMGFGFPPPMTGPFGGKAAFPPGTPAPAASATVFSHPSTAPAAAGAPILHPWAPFGAPLPPMPALPTPPNIPHIPAHLSDLQAPPGVSLGEQQLVPPGESSGPSKKRGRGRGGQQHSGTSGANASVSSSRSEEEPEWNEKPKKILRKGGPGGTNKRGGGRPKKDGAAAADTKSSAANATKMISSKKSSVVSKKPAQPAFKDLSAEARQDLQAMSRRATTSSRFFGVGVGGATGRTHTVFERERHALRRGEEYRNDVGGVTDHKKAKLEWQMEMLYNTLPTCLDGVLNRVHGMVGKSRSLLAGVEEDDDFDDSSGKMVRRKKSKRRGMVDDFEVWSLPPAMQHDIVREVNELHKLHCKGYYETKRLKRKREKEERVKKGLEEAMDARIAAEEESSSDDNSSIARRMERARELGLRGGERVAQRALIHRPMVGGGSAAGVEDGAAGGEDQGFGGNANADQGGAAPSSGGNNGFLPGTTAEHNFLHGGSSAHQDPQLDQQQHQPTEEEEAEAAEREKREWDEEVWRDDGKDELDPDELDDMVGLFDDGEDDGGMDYY